MSNSRIAWQRAEIVIAGTALVVSMFSLFFSIRANMIAAEGNDIARQEYLRAVDIQSAAFDRSRTTSNPDEPAADAILRCRHKIRLVNSGNSADELIGYEVGIFYKDQQLYLKADEAYAANYSDEMAAYQSDLETSIPTLHSFKAVLIDEEGASDDLDDADEYSGSRLPIPFLIDDSVDIYAQVDFSLKDGRGILSEAIRQHEQMDATDLEGYSEVRVTYALDFASGDRESLEQPLLCYYLSDYLF